MSLLWPEIFERRDRIRAWFECLQARICAELERLEDEALAELYSEPPGRFEIRPWSRESGVGGGSGGFLKGRLFEKASVHTSAALARFSPEMAAQMPGADKDPTYVSASISVIVHPWNPRTPAVHMNTRFLSAAESWFGGGADLTPMLNEQRSQEADDAKLFHSSMQDACDPFDPAWYGIYKAWCDEYFYLPHRKEPRGIGGIFYDRLNSGDFLPSGISKAMGFTAFSASLAAKGLPYADAWAAAAIAIQVFGPISLILGIAPRWTSLALIAFVIMATATTHRYWEFADATARRAQEINFYKNTGILAGLLFYFVSGAGAWSVSGRRVNRPAQMV